MADVRLFVLSGELTDVRRRHTLAKVSRVPSVEECRLWRSLHSQTLFYKPCAIYPTMSSLFFSTVVFGYKLSFVMSVAKSARTLVQRVLLASSRFFHRCFFRFNRFAGIIPGAALLPTPRRGRCRHCHRACPHATARGKDLNEKKKTYMQSCVACTLTIFSFSSVLFLLY